MDRARDQLLAGAALAADEHGDVGVGDAADQLAHLAHLVARAEQLAGDAGATRGGDVSSIVCGISRSRASHKRG